MFATRLRLEQFHANDVQIARLLGPHGAVQILLQVAVVPLHNGQNERVREGVHPNFFGGRACKLTLTSSQISALDMLTTFSMFPIEFEFKLEHSATTNAELDSRGESARAEASCTQYRRPAHEHTQHVHAGQNHAFRASVVHLPLSQPPHTILASHQRRLD